MDRDADRHGEQDWGGNWRGEAKRRGRRRAARNKKPHATKRCSERITAGILAYLHLSANFFVFWPPQHLTWRRSLCASQGCSSEAVYRTGQLISFWRGPLVARPFSGLIPISLPLLTLVCPSRHNDLCHSRLRRIVTWLHFETQVVLLWLSNRLGKWSWLWGKKGTGCPCKEIQTSQSLDSKYRWFCFWSKLVMFHCRSVYGLFPQSSLCWFSVPYVSLACGAFRSLKWALRL